MLPTGNLFRPARGAGPLAGLAAAALAAWLTAGCGNPRARSERSYDEIHRLVGGKSAGEVVELLGVPDSRQPIFGSDEKWIWWNYTFLAGGDHPPELRGRVVHLEIVFRNPIPAAGSRRPIVDWRVDEPFGVSFLLPATDN